MKIGLQEIEGLALLGVGLLVWRGWKAGTFNPASRDNALYQATGQIGMALPVAEQASVDALYGNHGAGAVAADRATLSQRVPTLRATNVPKVAPGYYDLGAKPAPVDDSRATGTLGALPELRDMGP